MKLMKKTITILILFSVMLSLNATTYYVGADGGLTINSIVAGEGYRKYEYSAQLGYKASVSVVIMFTDNLGLNTGLAMYGKNYKGFQTVSVDGENQENYNLEINNGFLEFPVAFRASISLQRFDFYGIAGGYMGLWLYGNRSGKVMNGNNKAQDVNESIDFSLYNRFEAGLIATTGVAINFGCFKGYAQYEYSFSLTDMNKSQKHGSFPIHNSTSSITLGLLWGINK